MEHPNHVASALEWYEAGMDEVDAFATFEKTIPNKAVRLNITQPIILLTSR